MSRLLTFYGDDFTGSTDVALQYHRFGLRTVLVTAVPEPARARELAAGCDVLGIAGVTRSCSTADSSPETGSFGPALELGRARFGERPVPLLVAQPNLGRYTLFGHPACGADRTGPRPRLRRARRARAAARPVQGLGRRGGAPPRPPSPRWRTTR